MLPPEISPQAAMVYNKQICIDGQAPGVIIHMLTADNYFISKENIAFSP